MDLTNYRVDIGAVFFNWLELMRDIVSDSRAQFWWPTVAVALVGAIAVTYRRRPKSAAAQAASNFRYADFLRELPVDIICFLAYTFTLVLMGPLLLMTTVAGTGLVFLLAGIPAMHTGSTNLTEQMVMAALIFICSDFFLYWSHRIFHLFNPLWRLHVLHHRPPVLTPITAFRFWPPEAAVHFIAFNLGAGIAIGIASTIFGIGVAPATYAGLNVFLLVWYLAFSHLRHSHVPLYFPRPFSFLFVSPHMHQAHHSIEVQHHHRNFGTALAIWDWMFGTLFIPAGNERFQFGVIDAEPAKWREKSA